MGVHLVGISLQPELLEALDRLAAGEGRSRSAMVGRLVEAELERRAAGRRDGFEVVVDGVRYVPARRRVAR